MGLSSTRKRYSIGRSDLTCVEQPLSSLCSRSVVREKIKSHGRGEASLQRFADDFVVTFQFRQDADHFPIANAGAVREIRVGTGRGENSARTLWTIRSRDMPATRHGKIADLRVSGIQTRRWGGSSRAVCTDSYPRRRELPEVPSPDTRMDPS